MKKQTKTIPVYGGDKYKHSLKVRVNNSTNYIIQQHKREIKTIRQLAKADIRRHKLLIKQAKITARLEQM